MKPVVMLGVAIVLAVALSVGLSFFLLGRNKGHTAAPAAKEEPPAALEAGGKPVNLDSFTTNLNDAGNHFIQVTFVLLAKDDKTAEKLTSSKMVLRDAVLQILRAKTAKDIAGPDGGEKLARDVLARLSELAGADAIKKVLITEFVVQ